LGGWGGGKRRPEAEGKKGKKRGGGRRSTTRKKKIIQQKDDPERGKGKRGTNQSSLERKGGRTGTASHREGKNDLAVAVKGGGTSSICGGRITHRDPKRRSGRPRQGKGVARRVRERRGRKGG